VPDSGKEKGRGGGPRCKRSMDTGSARCLGLDGDSGRSPPSDRGLVCEFYANLYRKAGDSFYTWVKEKEIHVTPNLISTITGAL
jgi:hypothetical protein